MSGLGSLLSSWSEGGEWCSSSSCVDAVELVSSWNVAQTGDVDGRCLNGYRYGSNEI